MSWGVFRARGVRFLVMGGGGSSRGKASSPTALQSTEGQLHTAPCWAPPACPSGPGTGCTLQGHSPVLSSRLSCAQHSARAGVHLHSSHGGQAGRLPAAQEVIHLGAHGLAQVAEVLAASGPAGLGQGAHRGRDVLCPWRGCCAGAGILKHALVHWREQRGCEHRAAHAQGTNVGQEKVAVSQGPMLALPTH